MIEKFDPNDEKIVDVTPNAIIHFQNYLANKKGSIGIRLSTKKTGCSGLSYVVEAITEVPDNHKLIEVSGLRFYMDNAAKKFLSGLILDYVKKDLGLSQVIYHNPNESARCGCGESFTVNEIKN